MRSRWLTRSRVRYLAVLLFATLAPAADWVRFKAGPFEVLSNAGEREGRDTLNFLEQLRHTLGAQLGTSDLQPVWPVRVLVLENRAQVNATPRLGRDAYMMSVPEQMTPEAVAGVVRLLLDGWPGYLPPPIHRGLVQLYSTLEVDGTRIRVGVPPAQKDRDWTRAHLFAVHPDYSGKLRVLLGNLSRGVESEIAYRNAFAQTADQIEKAVDAYMAAGQYNTVPGNSKPMNARRELIGKDVEDSVGQLAQADLQLANANPGAEAAYAAILKAKPDSAEAHEGLGLVALQAGRKDEAREHLKQSASAHGMVEYGKLLTEPEPKRAALLKAATLNKRWAEPHDLLAALETHPAQQIAALRKSAELAPRNADTWMALADLQEQQQQFTEAAKSWAAAERTTDDPNERARIRQFRLAGEKKRVDAQIAAREAARRKSEEELQALRNKALLEIRAAEARANAGKPVIDPSTLGVYQEGANTVKVSGVLSRVDCVGRQAILHVTSGKQITRLFVTDPGQVALAGGGQLALTCGPQRGGGRRVTVEYLPRPDATQNTVGDTQVIEFGK